jgi:molybdate transport system substrate-binding protein
MVQSLQDSGALDARPRTPLGRVRTGIAVRSGEPLPDVATPESLKACLMSALALYVPDTERSTAGIHFLSVLRELGIDEALASRMRTFPNGATAMRELASSEPGAIGCTQITEILYTPGIALVGALPSSFELATVYSAALSAASAQADAAQRFVDLLGSESTRALRAEGGFEFD